MLRTVTRLLLCSLICCLGMISNPAESGEIDTDKSTFILIARSGEDIRPVLGERLEGKITLKDADGKPVAGIKGADIEVISIEDGKTTTIALSGETNANGEIFAAFSPGNTQTEHSVNIAVKVGGKVLSTVREIKYYRAIEFIDQSQPLRSGAARLWGSRTIGQSFKVGRISHISRINVMSAKNEGASQTVGTPVMKLYAWKGDLKSTLAADPLKVLEKPQTYSNPYYKRFIMAYNADLPVSPGEFYYFELSIPDKSGDKEKNFYYVWNCWHPEGSFFPCSPDPYLDGMAFISGSAQPKMDLAFHIFAPSVPKEARGESK
ncbi:MAG: hypothetical protein PHX89_04375 [bacterium]|nr:hypothetical protein [bacterium]